VNGGPYGAFLPDDEQPVPDEPVFQIRENPFPRVAAGHPLDGRERRADA
jgi:hypothetical protein